MSSKSLTTAYRREQYYRCDIQDQSPRDRLWSGSARVADEERSECAVRTIAECRKKVLDALAFYRCESQSQFPTTIREVFLQINSWDWSKMSSSNHIRIILTFFLSSNRFDCFSISKSQLL